MAFHVDLAGVLFIVWGALVTLIGLSTLALGVAATALASSSADRQLAAGVMAAAFTTLAVLAILWGVAHIVVGVPLRRHRHWSRLAALMISSVDLLLLPYGTVIGCYTLWALLHQGGRRMFTETGT